MFNRANIKQIAKTRIDGNKGNFFLILFIISVITGICSVIPFVNFVAYIFLFPVFVYGIVYASWKMGMGQHIEVRDAFVGFSNIGPAMGLYYWNALMSIVPVWNIIAAYKFRYSYYSYMENPQLGVWGNITRSNQLTDGYKMDLFVMDLSFIGWLILTPFTLYILGYVFVFPYMAATNCVSYKQICSMKGMTSTAQPNGPVYNQGQPNRPMQNNNIGQQSTGINAGKQVPNQIGFQPQNYSYGANPSMSQTQPQAPMLCSKCGRPLVNGRPCSCQVGTETVDVFTLGGTTNNRPMQGNPIPKATPIRPVSPVQPMVPMQPSIPTPPPVPSTPTPTLSGNETVDVFSLRSSTGMNQPQNQNGGASASQTSIGGTRSTKRFCPKCGKVLVNGEQCDCSSTGDRPSPIIRPSSKGASHFCLNCGRMLYGDEVCECQKNK